VNFNKKLIYLRNNKNLTQKQLAERLNVSRATISGWETGRNVPDLEMVVKICDFFRVSLDYMLRSDKKTLKRISMSKKKKNILIIIIIILLLIVLFFAKQFYESEVSTLSPESIKIVKVDKEPVKIGKNNNDYDYQYNVYVKLNSLFNTWDIQKHNVINFPSVLYGKGKYKNKVFVSYNLRKSLNIFKNIKNNNSVQKLRIFSQKKLDNHWPYNKGKSIVLYDGHNQKNKDNKIIISEKNNS
jgi:transcriptional regulator with XRE-family HTH domain